VCADGALEWAKQGGIEPDVCLGDFDSLGFIPDGGVVYPAEKDLTDGEIALEYLLNKGVEQIEIYGGAGRRDDHYFGNVGLLYKAHIAGAHAVFCTDHTRFYLSEGRVLIKNKKGTVVSLVPLSKTAHIVEGKGFKYSLKEIVLTAGESRGLSNVVTLDEAEFTVAEGLCLVFEVCRP